MLEMELRAHGGNCCGMAHIFRMGTVPTKDRLNRLDKLIADFVNNEENPDPLVEDWDYDNDNPIYRDRVGCIEVVLAGLQMDEGWPKELENRDFKEVSKFLNGNSDNICHVYHKYVK